VQISRIAADQDASPFPLVLSLEACTPIRGRLKLSADLYDPEDVSRFARRLETLFEAALLDPDADLDQLDVMPPEEAALVLGPWSRNDCDFRRDLCAHELFEHCARNRPTGLHSSGRTSR
jgi:non-ribosomal peptide synthetase component F